MGIEPFHLTAAALGLDIKLSESEDSENSSPEAETVAPVADCYCCSDVEGGHFRLFAHPKPNKRCTAEVQDERNWRKQRKTNGYC